MPLSGLSSFMRRTKVQVFFARMRPLREWIMIAGEGIAVLTAVSVFLPWVPESLKAVAIPFAVISGASALLLVAIFDKLDPTRPPVIVGGGPVEDVLGPGVPNGRRIGDTTREIR